jgi:hypothetical protein
LLDIVPSLVTIEDFKVWDGMIAELDAREASHDKWTASTLGDVAEFFGAALQTVKQWRMESPPMPGIPGNYPLPEITKWRRDKDMQSDLAAAKRQQDFELGKIQVETKQIELDREKALIVDRQDVELWAATALVELRESIMQLPEKLAASAPESLKNFVRSESDTHCRDSLIAASRRLDIMEIGKDRGTE